MVAHSLFLVYLASVYAIVRCQLNSDVPNLRKESLCMTKYYDFLLNVATKLMGQHRIANNDVELYSDGKYHLNYINPIHYIGQLQNRAKEKMKHSRNSTFDIIRGEESNRYTKRGDRSQQLEALITNRFPADVFLRKNKILQKMSTIIKKTENSPPESSQDFLKFLSIQKNYFTIPKKTFELLQSADVCSKRENEVRPCETVFTKSSKTGRIWPRDLLAASCRCDDQRCNVMGVDTCKTLYSRITVIDFQGNRSRNIIPVACVCMAQKAIQAKEILPMIV